MAIWWHWRYRVNPMQYPRAQVVALNIPFQGCVNTGRIRSSDTGKCAPASAPRKGLFSAATGVLAPRNFTGSEISTANLEKGSRPVSRVLSWTIIHLGPSSPTASSNLPESSAGRIIAFLFGLAPGGVYLAAACCHLRGALLPHHFTLTFRRRRYPFCCTFRRLAPPRRYLASYPAEPGLSSRSMIRRLPG